MKKFMQEFREFALRGNMIELAVGIIIGSAFTALVQSLVTNVINPIIGIFLGHVDFSELFISLNGKHYDSLAEAVKSGASVLKYGSFISAVINFIIMALVVFCLVKGLNTLAERVKRKEVVAEPTEKECPYCKTMIAISATRCPHCTSILEEAAVQEMK